jgi:hypothetical protein
MPGDPQADIEHGNALVSSTLTQKLTTTAYSNPFASVRIDALTFVPELESVQTLLRKVRRLRFRCMISGPHGSGKSTLLREISRRLAEEGYSICRCQFKPGLPRWHKVRALLRRIGSRRISVVDGADHLSPVQWGLIWWKSCTTGGLIVTSHEKRLLPLLTRRTTSAQLLRTLCDQLDISAELPAGLLDELFVQHQGNIREVFRHLYDIWAG